MPLENHALPPTAGQELLVLFLKCLVVLLQRL